MEDYGMCCGESEAIQCSREYYARLIEEDLRRAKTTINVLLGLLIFSSVITIPILLYLLR